MKKTKTHYNYFKMAFDVIRCKVKIKDLLLAKKISRVYDSTTEFNIATLTKLLKFKPTQIFKAIEIHNEYAINKADRFKITDFLNYLENYMKNLDKSDVVKNKLLFQFLHGLISNRTLISK